MEDDRFANDLPYGYDESRPTEEEEEGVSIQSYFLPLPSTTFPSSLRFRRSRSLIRRHRIHLFSGIKHYVSSKPYLVTYLIALFCIAVYPLVISIPRLDYGFLVRPYPGPTDVAAFLQKFVFDSDGVFVDWMDWVARGNEMRGFKWEYPIEELINAEPPAHFPKPILSPVTRVPRRHLGQCRNETKLDHAGLASTLATWTTPFIPLNDSVSDDRVHRSSSFSRLFESTSLHHSGDDIWDITSPAILALHTFSMATTKSRIERDRVRRYQRTRLPDEYIHLIDFQFVVCSPFGSYDNAIGFPSDATLRNKTMEQRQMWSQLVAEQEEYGDIIVINEMEQDLSSIMKENMEQGKTYAWMKEVAQRAKDGRGREALFVMKTDSDAYHIMPNLLNFILSYDPSLPVYFGSSLGSHYSCNMYFQGMGYGFSWPLLKTLVSAQLPGHLLNGYEDHITGSWMYSLPASRQSKESKTNLHHHQHRPHHPHHGDHNELEPPKRTIPNSLRAFTPMSPDPYTGLIRVDMYEKAGSRWYWWIPKTERLITAHGMKSKKEYLDVWETLESYWRAPSWIGQRASSVPYMWDPPDWIKKAIETE